MSKKIGILVASTSKNCKYDSFMDYYFIKNIKTLIGSLSNNNTFIVYIGYDEGDLFFEEKEQEIVDYLNTLIPTKIYKIKNISTSNPCYVWNCLAKTAYYENCDYLFQTGDDTIYETKNWDETFINYLLKSNDIGVAGGINSNTKIITLLFVSKKHYEIFNCFFSPVFKNWYSDDWVNNIYKPNYYYFDRNVITHNSIIATDLNRYIIDHAGGILASEVIKGKKQIKEYLDKNKGNA